MSLLLFTNTNVFAKSWPWTMQIKGGAFLPALDGWEDYYGSNKGFASSANFGMRLFKIFEPGIEVSYFRDVGQGFLPVNNQFGGTVSYELLPVDAYLNLRAEFFNRQWVIPYAGINYGRQIYQQKIANQDSVRGGVNGIRYKLGLLVLLDGFDKSSAKMLNADFGIKHSYLSIEAQQSSADIGGIDLGGYFFLSGFAFSF